MEQKQEYSRRAFLGKLADLAKAGVGAYVASHLPGCVSVNSIDPKYVGARDAFLGNAIGNPTALTQGATLAFLNGKSVEVPTVDFENTETTVKYLGPEGTRSAIAAQWKRAATMARAAGTMLDSRKTLFYRTMDRIADIEFADELRNADDKKRVKIVDSLLSTLGQDNKHPLVEALKAKNILQDDFGEFTGAHDPLDVVRDTHYEAGNEELQKKLNAIRAALLHNVGALEGYTRASLWPVAGEGLYTLDFLKEQQLESSLHIVKTGSYSLEDLGEALISDSQRKVMINDKPETLAMLLGSLKAEAEDLMGSKGPYYSDRVNREVWSKFMQPAAAQLWLPEKSLVTEPEMYGLTNRLGSMICAAADTDESDLHKVARIGLNLGARIIPGISLLYSGWHDGRRIMIPLTVGNAIDKKPLDELPKEQRLEAMIGEALRLSGGAYYGFQDWPNLAGDEIPAVNFGLALLDTGIAVAAYLLTQGRGKHGRNSNNGGGGSNPAAAGSQTTSGGLK